MLVVPSLRRLFATATDLNQVLTLDDDTGTVLGGAATGAYPDGLAYDPTRNRVWITNGSGGTQSVLDAATVDVGGDAGNVAYDPGPGTPGGTGPGAPTPGGRAQGRRPRHRTTANTDSSTPSPA
jgi:DNA-binding beta-propeller fold protein YncE